MSRVASEHGLRSDQSAATAFFGGQSARPAVDAIIADLNVRFGLVERAVCGVVDSYKQLAHVCSAYMFLSGERRLTSSQG